MEGIKQKRYVRSGRVAAFAICHLLEVKSSRTSWPTFSPALAISFILPFCFDRSFCTSLFESDLKF